MVMRWIWDGIETKYRVAVLGRWQSREVYLSLKWPQEWVISSREAPKVFQIAAVAIGREAA